MPTDVLCWCEICSTSTNWSCFVVIKSLWPSKDQGLGLKRSYILIYCWLNLLNLVFAQSIWILVFVSCIDPSWPLSNYIYCVQQWIVVSKLLHFTLVDFHDVPELLSWCRDNPVKMYSRMLCRIFYLSATVNAVLKFSVSKQ